jgi:hypothetical protein
MKAKTKSRPTWIARYNHKMYGDELMNDITDLACPDCVKKVDRGNVGEVLTGREALTGETITRIISDFIPLKEWLKKHYKSEIDIGHYGCSYCEKTFGWFDRLL